MTDEFGVGIIGYGVMGRTHAEAYVEACHRGIPCRVRGVFSLADPAQLVVGNLEAMAAAVPGIEEARFTSDVEDILADDMIRAVSVCTPTDTHVELAMRALAAGKHVLVEKPVALDPADIDRLAAAAAAADRICMPAMCMRFWPGWRWLHEQIRTGSMGVVRSASFVRVGNPPGWSREFYDDRTRSGGALHDLHVHDVDFVRWCFGVPAAVSSSGGPAHIHTHYHFAAGPAPVTAEGGWIAAEGFPFRMRFSVEFESAFAEFDLESGLRLTRHGETRTVEMSAASAYHEEVRHFLNVIRRGEAPRVTLRDAATAARIIAAEAKSAAAGGARTPLMEE